MLVGTNLKYTKAYNVRIVLETIRRFGPLSRAEVARRTELTAQTVSNITRELLETDLVRETERLREGRGAPATLLALNADGAFSIGLDLDKDHLTGVLVDFVGTVRERIHYELNFPSPDEAMDLLAETTQELIRRQELTTDDIWGVGVGLPGPLGISKDSVVTNVVNPKAFPGWKNVPVADLLSERLQLPLYIENNATAAAIGERWYGDGQHIRTFFYLYFGAGLGGGLIINGQPHEGLTGNAGEIGYCYLPTQDEPDATALFQRPHLGVFFNLPRLYRHLKEQNTLVSQPDALADLFVQQHPVLLEWLDTGARHLAPVILAVEYLLDPEAIFFGGRLPDVLIDALIERLKAHLPALRIEGKTTHPALLTGTAGADAAALGVATLPMYTSFAPAPGVLLKQNNSDVDTNGTEPIQTSASAQWRALSS